MRNERLQNAYKTAATVPFNVAKKGLRVMELAGITTKKGNRNAITDSGVGAFMAYSGIKGAVLNVKVNLKYIEDNYFNDEKEQEIEKIEKRAEEVLEEIMWKIRGSLHP